MGHGTGMGVGRVHLGAVLVDMLRLQQEQQEDIEKGLELHHHSWQLVGLRNHLHHHLKSEQQNISIVPYSKSSQSHLIDIEYVLLTAPLALLSSKSFLGTAGRFGVSSIRLSAE